jgi:hypothetical protein
VAFKTLERRKVPKWNGEPGQKPFVDVQIRAVKRGENGNVGAGAISNAPQSLRIQAIAVTNPAPTRGGSQDVVKRIKPADCQGAIAKLRTDLATQLAAQAAEPATPGLVRFPASQRMEEPVITPSCESLVGTVPEGESFELTAQATGTVLEVDEALVVPTAKEHFELSTPVGIQIEPGSIQASVREPIVAFDAVTFPVEIRAMATKQCDALEIEDEIAGLTVAQALEKLVGCGDATITLWPDFVPTLPDDIGRITLHFE